LPFGEGPRICLGTYKYKMNRTVWSCLASVMMTGWLGWLI
jgi:hypothetical protein